MGFILQKILPIAVFLALVIISEAGAGTLGKTIPAQVVSITDGDTLVVRLQGRKEKVRLIGIDTSFYRKLCGRRGPDRLCLSGEFTGCDEVGPPCRSIHPES